MLIRLLIIIYLITSILDPFKTIEITAQFLSIIFSPQFEVGGCSITTILAHLLKCYVFFYGFILLYTLSGINCILDIVHHRPVIHDQPTIYLDSQTNKDVLLVPATLDLPMRLSADLISVTPIPVDNDNQNNNRPQSTLSPPSDFSIDQIENNDELVTHYNQQRSSSPEIQTSNLLSEEVISNKSHSDSIVNLVPLDNSMPIIAHHDVQQLPKEASKIIHDTDLIQPEHPVQHDIQTISEKSSFLSINNNDSTTKLQQNNTVQQEQQAQLTISNKSKMADSDLIVNLTQQNDITSTEPYQKIRRISRKPVPVFPKYNSNEVLLESLENSFQERNRNDLHELFNDSKDLILIENDKTITPSLTPPDHSSPSAPGSTISHNSTASQNSQAFNSRLKAAMQKIVKSDNNKEVLALDDLPMNTTQSLDNKVSNRFASLKFSKKSKKPSEDDILSSVDDQQEFPSNIDTISYGKKSNAFSTLRISKKKMKNDENLDLLSDLTQNDAVVANPKKTFSNKLQKSLKSTGKKFTKLFNQK